MNKELNKYFMSVCNYAIAYLFLFVLSFEIAYACAYTSETDELIGTIASYIFFALTFCIAIVFFWNIIAIFWKTNKISKKWITTLIIAWFLSLAGFIRGVIFC